MVSTNSEIRSDIRWLLLSVVGTLILTFSCRITPEVDDANIVVIKGRVNAQDIDEVIIDRFIDNPYSIEQKKFSTIVDSSSQFYFRIPIESMSTGRISFGDFTTTISFKPGDEQFIEFGSGEIKFRGKGGMKNSFLNELRVKDLDSRQIDEAFDSAQMPPEEFLSLINEVHSKQQKILDSYMGEIDPDFALYFGIGKRTTANMLLQYYPNRYAKNWEIQAESLVLSDEFKTLNRLRSVVNDSFVISSSYSGTLDFPIYLAAQGLVDDGAFPTIDAARYAVIFDSLQPRTREYYLARTVGLLYMLDRVDTILVDEFNHMAKDSLAIKAVTVAKNRFEAKHSLKGKKLIPEFSNTVLKDINNRATTLGTVLEGHKGRVVYLDLWSLTCGPCLKAMPFAETLRSKLSDEPIDFIFLTLDTFTPDLWKRVFETTRTDKRHYLLEKRFDSQMLKFMGVNYLPIYMIFDKEGQIADINAPSPISLQNGSNELETKLRTLARE